MKSTSRLATRPPKRMVTFSRVAGAGRRRRVGRRASALSVMSLTTGRPVSSPVVSRVLILIALSLVQLRLALTARQQALRTQQHHRHQHAAVDEEPVLGELAEQLGQADQHERADHHAGDVAHPAQDDERQRVDADEDVEAAREDRRRSWPRRARRTGSRTRRRARRRAACSSMVFTPVASATDSSSRIAFQARPDARRCQAGGARWRP